MLRKTILPLFAVGMLIFAVGHALYIQRPERDLPPPVPPPTTPFGNTVAGLGMVEASTKASGTGNIAIGSQVAGAVVKVWVSIDQPVKAGDVLFELDPRPAQADLQVKEANVLVNDAQVQVAEADLRKQKDQFDRARMLNEKQAIAPQDFVTIKQTYQSSRAQLALAKANVEQARAQVQQAKTNLALLKVQAPVAGTILQVNIRPGEYVSTFSGQTLILMGNLKPLHVRVNVDEEDLPRLRLGAPAIAKIRGDAKQEEIPLTYVRLEPYIVPKTSLTGANTERVDTRVVQVIYAIDPENPLVQKKKILVGQLLDVFIDTRPISPSEGP